MCYVKKDRSNLFGYPFGLKCIDAAAVCEELRSSMRSILTAIELTENAATSSAPEPKLELDPLPPPTPPRVFLPDPDSNQATANCPSSISLISPNWPGENR